MSSNIFVFFLILAAGASVLQAQARSCSSKIPLPKYTYKDHPLHNERLFPLSPRPSPAVVSRYYPSNMWKFSPRNTTLTSFSTNMSQRHVLIENADSLDGFGNTQTVRKKQLSLSMDCMKVEVNNNATVYIVISVDKANKGWPHNVEVKVRSKYDKSTLEVRKYAFSFLHNTAPPVVLDHNSTTGYGSVLLKMEGHADPSKQLCIPRPGMFEINGNRVDRVDKVIFVQVQDSSSSQDPIPFDEPSLPSLSSVNAILQHSDVQNTEPLTEVIRPKSGEECPTWLHHIHVAPGKLHENDVVSAPEFKYWRTWHPNIDPIYWCYYGHEHGAFPGNYPPWFGYTAFKTMVPVDDKSPKFWEQTCSPTQTPTPTPPDFKRQDESNHGFKILNFVVPSSKCEPNGDRIVMITLHAHLSNERRFTARHHTMMISIFRMAKPGDESGRQPLFEDGYIREAQLHFKADFGKGVARVGIINAKSKLDRKKIYSGPCQNNVPNVGAFRRFQVFIKEGGKVLSPKVRMEDIDDLQKKQDKFNFTMLSERLTSKYNADFDEEAVKKWIYVSHDGYERWDAPLIHTCMKPTCETCSINKMDFQFRDSASTLLFNADSGTFEKSNYIKTESEKHTSMNRVIRHGGALISKSNCVLNVAGTDRQISDMSGTFYTDPYFRYVRDGPNSDIDPKKTSILQYIADDFEELELPSGKISSDGDDWDKHMDYKVSGVDFLKSLGGGFHNIEGAVDQRQN